MSQPTEEEIAQQLQTASEASTALLSQLDELSRSTDLGSAWSSQVARCQSRLADRMKQCKDRLFDLDVYVEEECEPGYVRCTIVATEQVHTHLHTVIMLPACLALSTLLQVHCTVGPQL
jgi:hypothetical protein